MFTFLAILLGIGIGVFSDKANTRDRREYDRLADQQQMQMQLILHTRQDLKLVAFLLFALLIMLGVIADRV